MTTRTQNTWLIREMMLTVKPEHLTDDEIAVVASALASAHSRLRAERVTVADAPMAKLLALMPREACAEV